MKSETFKILKDKDGKRYRFSSEKFCDALDARKMQSTEEGKRLFKSDLRRMIAERISDTMKGSAFSDEAVANWEKGNNGPTSMDYVEIAAGVLGISKYDLLNSLDEEGEQEDESKFNATEKELVYDLFEKICRLWLEWADFEPEATDRRAKERQWDDNTKRAKRKLWSLTADIYSKSLFIRQSVQNRMVKMIMDMKFMFLCIPEEWRDFDMNYPRTVDQTVCTMTRDEIIEENRITDYYMYDEMDFADDLGLKGKNVEPDDLLCFEMDKGPEHMEQFGYHGEYEITTNMVYDHGFSRFLGIVFRNLFPEAFEN